MRIEVKSHLNFRAVVGDQTFRQVGKGTSVREFVQQLALGHGDDLAEVVAELEAGGGQPRIAILVNGRHGSHLPDGLDTVLCDDEVAIFPPSMGGQGAGGSCQSGAVATLPAGHRRGHKWTGRIQFASVSWAAATRAG